MIIRYCICFETSDIFYRATTTGDGFTVTGCVFSSAISSSAGYYFETSDNVIGITDSHLLTFTWFPSCPAALRSADSLSPQQLAILDCLGQQAGTGFLDGGENPGGFDSSGLTKYCFGTVGIELPHSPVEQFSHGEAVECTDALPGDLIFFDDNSPRNYSINLVGTFDVTRGSVWQIVELTSGDRVVWIYPDVLASQYYGARVMGCRRLWNEGALRSTAPQTGIQSASPATAFQTKEFTSSQRLYDLRRLILRTTHFAVFMMGPQKAVA
jgi:hypothetical protein